MLGSANSWGGIRAARSAPSLTTDMSVLLDARQHVCRLLDTRQYVCRLLDTRQYVELMERRRRRQGPFQRGRAGTPRIVRRPLLAHEGMDEADEEDDQADERDVGAERRQV